MDGDVQAAPTPQTDYPKAEAEYKEDEHISDAASGAVAESEDGKFIGPEQMFSQDNPPPRFEQEAELFRKTALTQAMRVHGPFTVETSEGPLHCEDGWVARDARGYFYPIADDEFTQIYERVKVEVVDSPATT